MALTKEDLQAIGALMDTKLAAALEPIKSDVAILKADVEQIKEDAEQIKEDTSITRDAVNGLGEWAEIVADALKIKYPVER